MGMDFKLNRKKGYLAKVNDNLQVSCKNIFLHLCINSLPENALDCMNSNGLTLYQITLVFTRDHHLN
jgi:hypothetical protein